MVETYTKLVDIAYNMHISGKFHEAKAVYEKLLEMNPNDLDVKNLYAQLNVALKNYNFAINLFQEVYSKTHLDEILINIAKVYMYKNEYKTAIETFDKLKVKDIQVVKLEALAHLKNSDYIKAIELYQTVILMEKASYADYFNLSIAYVNNSNNELALETALKAYDLNKKDVHILLHIASIYEQLNDYVNTIKFLEQTLSIVLDIKILYRIAINYEKVGDDEKAVAYLNEILNIQPENKDALLKIAIIYKNYDKNVTVEIINKLLKQYPEDTSLLQYLYTIYSDMLMHMQAVEIAVKLVNSFPNNYVYYTFAGDSYLALYDYLNAEIMFKKALELNPEYEYSAIQLAQALSAQNKIDLAIETLKKYSHNDIARDDLIFIQLKNKNFDVVKDDYYYFETRPKTQEQIEERAKRYFYKYNLDKKYGINEYDFMQLKYLKRNSTSDYLSSYLKKDCKDKDIKNKRLLVYSSHGVGDLLMVSRYFDSLTKIVSELILQVPKSCISLLQYNFPNVKFVSSENIVDENSYDYTTSTLCLFYLVNVNLREINTPDKFLSVNNEISTNNKIITSDKKVGLFWQGNPVILPNRSIRLEKLVPLLDVKNTSFYSFQIDKIDEVSENLKHKLPITDIAPKISSYEDTAGFLMNIDVLVTIDSSIAHLAGALGVKTYLLLPYDAEWRWFDDKETTPWYKSIKIFKQKEPNNWDEVIEKVRKDLEN